MNGLGNRSRSLAKSFASFKPNARPLAVPIEENNAARLERAPQFHQRFVIGISAVLVVATARASRRFREGGKDGVAYWQRHESHSVHRTLERACSWHRR